MAFVLYSLRSLDLFATNGKFVFSVLQNWSACSRGFILPKFRFTSAFYQRGKTGETGVETQTKSQEEIIVAYCNVTRIEDLAMVADNICHCTL